MSVGCNQNPFATDEVCDEVRKPGEVNTVVTADTLAPQKRLTNDCCADALDLGTKPCAQACHALLVESGCLLGIRFGLWMKFEHYTH